MVEKIRLELELPQGAAFEADGGIVAVKLGGKEASRKFSTRGITFRQEGSRLIIEGFPPTRRMNAMLNTIAGHIRNMLSGMQADYVYRLAVVYSHFPVNVSVKGDLLEIKNFLGEKHPRTAKILPEAKAEVKGKEIFIRSSSKEAAGQTAANIETATKVRGRDRRVYQDGIFIVEKAQQVKRDG